MNDTSVRQTLIDMAQGYFRGKALCACVRGRSTRWATARNPSTTLPSQRDRTRTPYVACYVPWPASASSGSLGSGGFALRPLGHPLRKDSPNTVWASIVFWSDLIADSWTYLPECVQTGGRSAHWR